MLFIGHQQALTQVFLLPESTGNRGILWTMPHSNSMARLSMTDIRYWYAAGSCLVWWPRIQWTWNVEPPIVNWLAWLWAVSPIIPIYTLQLASGWLNWHAMADGWHYWSYALHFSQARILIVMQMVMAALMLLSVCLELIFIWGWAVFVSPRFMCQYFNCRLSTSCSMKFYMRTTISPTICSHHPPLHRVLRALS